VTILLVRARWLFGSWSMEGVGVLSWRAQACGCDARESAALPLRVEDSEGSGFFRSPRPCCSTVAPMLWPGSRPREAAIWIGGYPVESPRGCGRLVPKRHLCFLVREVSAGTIQILAAD
jgi:hypothetical protein